MNEHANLPAVATPPTDRVLAISPRGMFSDKEKFEFSWRVAGMFAASRLVPQHMQGQREDCMIALNVAERLGEDPLTIMQNIILVNGKPGWMTAYMIARANRAGVFASRINWRVTGTPGKDMAVTAHAAMADTGEIAEVTVTWDMATKEGWLSNKKYQSMPEHMLRWRSAAMLIRLFCPDVMLGFQTAEELETEASMKDVSPGRGNTVAQRVQGPPPAPPPVAKSAATDVQNIVDGREPGPLPGSASQGAVADVKVPPPPPNARKAAEPGNAPQGEGPSGSSAPPPPVRGSSQELSRSEEVPGIKSRTAPPPSPPSTGSFGKQEQRPDDMAEAAEYARIAATVKTEEDLDRLQRQYLPAFEQRWGMAARNLAQNAYEDTLKRMEAKPEPQQAEAPSEFLANSLAQAQQKGAMAATNGMARTAVPKKFNEDQTAAWLAGYDEAAKQKEVK